MSTLTFDTLKFADRLKSAGIPAVHAEAEAKALSEVLETNLGELATKSDLREVETRLESKIEKTELVLRQEISGSVSSLRQEMTNMKVELIKWGIGFAIAQAGLLIAILKFFPINS
jgi:hypothetical protein